MQLKLDRLQHHPSELFRLFTKDCLPHITMDPYISDLPHKKIINLWKPLRAVFDSSWNQTSSPSVCTSGFLAVDIHPHMRSICLIFCAWFPNPQIFQLTNIFVNMTNRKVRNDYAWKWMVRNQEEDGRIEKKCNNKHV